MGWVGSLGSRAVNLGIQVQVRHTLAESHVERFPPAKELRRRSTPTEGAFLSFGCSAREAPHE